MQKPFHASLTEVYAHAVACLDSLIAAVSGRTAAAAGFEAARAALEALPLSTAEAATLRNRLDNAQAYAAAAEHGAAGFELRLLRGSPALTQARVLGDRKRSRSGPKPPEPGHRDGGKH
jgi:hypothetical protein